MSHVGFADDNQKEKALASIAQAQHGWVDPIVSELSPAPEFYPAEDYHQNYYSNHPTQGYCHVVIAPKIEKFMKKFGDKVKG